MSQRQALVLSALFTVVLLIGIAFMRVAIVPA